MRFIAGSSHPVLAQSVAEELLVLLEPALITTFKSQEIAAEITGTVLNDDVCVFQTLHPLPSDRLMELFMLIDALKRQEPKKIIAVIPYYSYGRSPETSALMERLLREAGACQIITIGLHDPLALPEVIHLDGVSLFCQDIQKRYPHDKPLIVSPDKGGADRACLIATHLKTDWVAFHKERSADGKVMVKEITGDVRGRPCILVDDIIDSGETLCCAADALTKAGAINVDAYAIHAVLSPGTLERLKESKINSLTVTDTIPQPNLSKVLESSRILSVSGALSEALRGLV